MKKQLNLIVNEVTYLIELTLRHRDSGDYEPINYIDVVIKDCSKPIQIKKIDWPFFWRTKIVYDCKIVKNFNFIGVKEDMGEYLYKEEELLKACEEEILKFKDYIKF